MKIRATVGFILLFTVILLTACSYTQSGKVDAASYQVGALQTWIDAPLDGSTIPLKSYEIVIHAYDPVGVTQVELSANGNLLANLSNPDSGKQLSTLKYNWLPAGPGNYTLQTRAKNAGGTWGGEARVVVTVSDVTITPTNTLTPNITVTPTWTSTPTETPTTTLTPTTTRTLTPTASSTAAALSFSPQISTALFYYGSCDPNEVTIQVFVPGDSVYSVVLFTHLQDQAGGGTTGWDEGTSMNPEGSSWFTRSVSSRNVTGAANYKNAWLLFQFVATNRSGKVIGRSAVYSDITLSRCGETRSPALPPFFVGPQIITISPATLIPPPR